MWPGPVVSLKEVRQTGSGRIELLVGQTTFPFIAALSKENVSKLYTEQGIAKPRPAIAICTYALTNDGKLALTVRGQRTNMYPGRLYGQGGNPLTTNTSIVQHQIDESKDELNLPDFSVNRLSGKFRFTGVVIDNEALPGKPDLVGWVPVDLSSDDIRERVYQRALSERPNDAVGVVFAPSDADGLFDYLVNGTHTSQYCPPSTRWLSALWKNQFRFNLGRKPSR